MPKSTDTIYNSNFMAKLVCLEIICFVRFSLNIHIHILQVPHIYIMEYLVTKSPLRVTV